MYWYFDEFFKRIRKFMEDLERDFRRLEESFMSEFPKIPIRELKTPFATFAGYEVETRPDAYIIKVPMPGVRKEDIDLRIVDDHIEIHAKSELSEEKESEEGAFFRGFVAEYHQVIPIPEDANKDMIAAKYKDGLLLIVIPRVKKEKGKKIPIE